MEMMRRVDEDLRRVEDSRFDVQGLEVRGKYKSHRKLSS
jgi:hypothetical protein